MDAHSGQIEVQSKPGTGTEFRLSIPLADAVRDQNPNPAGFNHASASDAERASANPREVPGDERSASHAPDAGDNGPSAKTDCAPEPGNADEGAAPNRR